MKSLVKLLKPTALQLILFLLILSVLHLYFNSYSVSYPLEDLSLTHSNLTIGIGSPITFFTDDNTTTIKIKWFALLLNIFLCYLLAAIIGICLVKVTKLKQPWVLFGATAILMIVVSFLISISLSKYYWGYYFFRPSEFSEIHHVTHVKSIIPVDTENDKEQKITIVKDPFTLSEYILENYDYEYYYLERRLLRVLDDRNLLPDGHGDNLTDFPDIQHLLKESGLLVQSEPGYDGGDNVKGILIHAVDKSGRDLVFIGLQSSQFANDSFAYYEMMLAKNNSTNEFEYVRGQRFFFDRAGIEGLEWYIILTTLSVMSICFGFVIVTIITVVFNLTKKLRAANQ